MARSAVDRGDLDPSSISAGSITAQLALSCFRQSGDRLDRYQLDEPIGAGGMGIIWSARDLDLGREVAIKLIRSCGRPLAELRARLLREARIMARLSDPNVVTIHDVGTTEEGLFLAMERMHGTLTDWLRAAPRGWPEIVGKFVAAGSGLAAAHRAGIVHRDFKAQNVLLAADGLAKVADFGLARVVADEPEPQLGEGSQPELAAQTVRAGTVLYMSPEQLLGQRIGARSDQFSFCVALFEALHGVRPFGDPPPEVAVPFLAAAIMEGRVVKPPASGKVPGRLERILRRGLSYHPADRWPNMDHLIDELARCRPRGWTRLFRRVASGQHSHRPAIVGSAGASGPRSA